MNLILLNKNQMISTTRAKLSERQVEHVNNVIKPQMGDFLRVGLIDQKMGLGEIKLINHKNIELDVRLTDDPPSKLPIHLYIALPRPKHMSRIIENLTSLGVSHIHFFHSYKVNKSFWGSDLLSEEKIFRAQTLGLEQSRDTILPKISFHRWFRPFVEDELPELSSVGDKIVAHPYAGPIIKSEISYFEKPIHLVLGPEGGFIDFEIDLLEKQNFKIYSFGERILKLETALTSITSQIIGKMEGL